MLSKEQRENFRMALAALNNSEITDVAELEIDDMIEDSQIVETADTVEQFFDAQGRRLNRRGERPATPFELNNTICGDVYKWDDVQARKGARRGSLYVMDFGTARAAFFDGEA